MKKPRLFVLLAVLYQVASQESPCPESFQYKNENGNLFGVIQLKPGYVGRIVTSVGFTVAAHLPTTYVGKLSLMDSRLSSSGYEGLHISGIRYRVDFPVTSPVPRITFLKVNDEQLCRDVGADPTPTQFNGSYKTTIALQHTLTLNNHGDFPSPPPLNPDHFYPQAHKPSKTTSTATPVDKHHDYDDDDDEDDDEFGKEQAKKDRVPASDGHRNTLKPKVKKNPKKTEEKVNPTEATRTTTVLPRRKRGEQ